MVEFVVDAKAFKKAIQQILVGRREYLHKDTADLIAVADSLALCSTGTSAEIDAVVVQAGLGRVTLPVLHNIRKVAPTFSFPRLHVEIGVGRIKIASYTLSHPDIELKPISARTADLPINATVIDALAMQKLYSAEEIVESGLAARVLDAQKKARRAISDAEYALHSFGVPREAIRDLVEAHIALHAKALRAAEGG